MINILAGILIFVVVVYYVIPYCMRLWGEHQIKNELRQIAKDGFKVIIPANKEIDYIIASLYGFFVIKKVVLTKTNSELKGEEEEKVWVQRIFSRLQLPYGALNRAERIPNPIKGIQLAINNIKKQLNNNPIPFYPIVIILPHIKSVNIIRKEESDVKIIYPKNILRIIDNIKKENDQLLDENKLKDITIKIQKVI